MHIDSDHVNVSTYYSLHACTIGYHQKVTSENSLARRPFIATFLQHPWPRPP